MFSALFGSLWPRKTSPKREVELTPTSHRLVSPEEFLQMCEKESDNIRSSSYIPPRMGDEGFGHFEVHLKRPVYQKS